MPTAERRATHRERITRVLELHRRGCDVRAIAAELGCTVTRASRLLAEALRSQPAADVDELRTGTEVRLDAVARVYGELLDDPDPKVRLAAAGGLRQAERDRAYLLGLWQKPPKDGD